MPKSKEFLDSDADNSSNEDVKPKKRARTEEKASKSKKAAKSKNEENTEAGNNSDSSNDRPSEDGLHMLSKNRFASVSEFKGKKYVNIREYYEKDGKSLPGKKGISLSVEQWENLKKNIEKIDDELKN
ncbi:Activated RNA polymerase II transcriptional coactivator p15 [Brachionus plicatilis]|uniref:Activated RNA polymerase II transcriptional coactivator p15 n=1 Tax=Brachionus plicatilis TaxID=10195 RepID=A0A3M7RPD7_BRAPC|nr:Activated RNA polymerase II transcriptional coactivator p15 [Brachionus plicatilis]